VILREGERFRRGDQEDLEEDLGIPERPRRKEKIRIMPERGKVRIEEKSLGIVMIRIEETNSEAVVAIEITAGDVMISMVDEIGMKEIIADRIMKENGEMNMRPVQVLTVIKSAARVMIPDHRTKKEEATAKVTDLKIMTRESAKEVMTGATIILPAEEDTKSEICIQF
jgi:hypothetical protein